MQLYLAGQAFWTQNHIELAQTLYLVTPPVSSAKRLFRARSSPNDVKHCVTTEAR